MHHPNDVFGKFVQRWAIVGLVLGALACSGMGDETKFPPDVPDPGALQTADGAMARYRGTIALLPGLLDSLLTMTGILTDELAALSAPLTVSREPYTSIDSRLALDGFGEAYKSLHRLRAQAREGRGFLQAYALDSSPAFRGHLYAMEGYAEIFLADVFCSGIPLSTVNFNGDYTLLPGSSTADVYRHAVALFDSAIAITSDSLELQRLAAVGKGRALMALGEYAGAATTVAGVPNDYKYQVVFVASNLLDRLLATFADEAGFQGVGYASIQATPSAADREGINGLDYRSSGDPRTASTALPGTDPRGNTMFFPSKYPVNGDVMLILADGIEARLIEAEAALHANPDDGVWLAKLNQLRATAITPALSDTMDPGTAAARLDLVFRERAFWLYLTAHRQGDMRRLVREYQRPAQAVYPIDAYPGAGGFYGNKVVAPVPASEAALNPKYTGCVHHGA